MVPIVRQLRFPVFVRHHQSWLLPCWRRHRIGRLAVRHTKHDDRHHGLRVHLSGSCQGAAEKTNSVQAPFAMHSFQASPALEWLSGLLSVLLLTEVVFSYLGVTSW